MAAPEPPRTRLRQLLERPEARRRVSRAVASLLAASIVALAALGVLVIWHLVRRGRLIREGLSRPRPVRWPELEPYARPPDGSTEDQAGLDHDRESPTEARDERCER